MYIPAAFRIEDQAVLLEFIEKYSFGVLVSIVDGRHFATHLPFLVNRDPPALWTHVAKANPQWYDIRDRQEVLAIFQGPHSYISPSCYAIAEAVPTWNYAVVHAYGSATIVDSASLEQMVDRLVTKYESGRPSPWPNRLPEEFRSKLMQAIVGIEIHITSLEGKFKLGQNRSAADQEALVSHLSAGSASERDLASFMRAWRE